ncbi:hypothetical protein [Amycolatopsis sp. SID8362]|uniref:hypothetical protein n=1 Tax=Amycolatopsis sp. SID8362 TaxID=2690346 RepID=UPI0013683491|nr:hypothetical protein [Amycolatopsis sp. SID8362]NBH05480.1 hypothetical protein [Amycolatopsis sp. SID8362]NED42180.1 hypothetical protein [Amycolatopsis sp. SID8362]
MIELENGLARGRATIAGFAEIRHTTPIAGDLGTVVVSGDSRLLAVDLDLAAVRYTTAAALGEAVLTAIRRAEQGSKDHRAEALAQAWGNTFT